MPRGMLLDVGQLLHASNSGGDERCKGEEEVVEVGLTVHIANIFEDAQLVTSGCFGGLCDVVEG